MNYLSFCLLCPADYEKYLILQEKSRIPSTARLADDNLHISVEGGEYCES